MTRIRAVVETSTEKALSASLKVVLSVYIDFPASTLSSELNLLNMTVHCGDNEEFSHLRFNALYQTEFR
jgi:hypothetical protein